MRKLTGRVTTVALSAAMVLSMGVPVFAADSNSSDSSKARKSPIAVSGTTDKVTPEGTYYQFTSWGQGSKGRHDKLEAIIKNGVRYYDTARLASFTTSKYYDLEGHTYKVTDSTDDDTIEGKKIDVSGGSNGSDAAGEKNPDNGFDTDDRRTSNEEVKAADGTNRKYSFQEYTDYAVSSDNDNVKGELVNCNVDDKENQHVLEVTAEKFGATRFTVTRKHHYYAVDISKDDKGNAKDDGSELKPILEGKSTYYVDVDNSGNYNTGDIDTKVSIEKDKIEAADALKSSLYDASVDETYYLQVNVPVSAATINSAIKAAGGLTVARIDAQTEDAAADAAKAKLQSILDAREAKYSAGDDSDDTFAATPYNASASLSVDDVTLVKDSFKAATSDADGYFKADVNITYKDANKTVKYDAKGGYLDFTITKGEVTDPYADVSDYAKDYAKQAVNDGAMSLVNGAFAAKDPITRIDYVYALWVKNGKQEPTTYATNFTDISGLTTDQQKAVLWASNASTKEGVPYISGTSATTFSPNENITRAQAVAVLYRVKGAPEITDEEYNLGTFSDVSSTAYYYDAVAYGVAQKYIYGTSHTTFSPKVDLQRQQAACFIYR